MKNYHINLKKDILKSYNSISNVEVKNIINKYFNRYGIGKKDGKDVLAIPNETKYIKKLQFLCRARKR